jgi:exopolyphosphatase / guanosine-5'-triphosphate,3'-diphosphate pyrophosphatase
MIAAHPVHLIGTSGTVTTLAGLHLGLERYERQKVDGLWMTSLQIDDTLSGLLKMPYERRVAHSCIGRDRADLVLPGCAIFEAIRREWPTDRVRVADRGLREGILISLIDADRAARPRR